MLGLVLIGFGTAMVLSTNAPSGSGEVDAQFWVDRLIEYRHLHIGICNCHHAN